MNKIKEIVFASTNLGKTEEVRKILAPFKIAVLDLKQAAQKYSLAPAPAVAETGKTYLDNVTLKAQAIFAWCQYPTLADDSGLEVDFLNGLPGVDTASYAGEGATREQMTSKLLKAMTGIENRNARYVSCVLLKTADFEKTAVGYLNGKITEKLRGEKGFGFDQIFEVAGGDQTLAQLKDQFDLPTTHRVLSVKELFIKD